MWPVLLVPPSVLVYFCCSDKTLWPQQHKAERVYLAYDSREVNQLQWGCLTARKLDAWNSKWRAHILNYKHGRESKQTRNVWVIKFLNLASGGIMHPTRPHLSLPKQHQQQGTMYSNARSYGGIIQSTTRGPWACLSRWDGGALPQMRSSV